MNNNKTSLIISILAILVALVAIIFAVSGSKKKTQPTTAKPVSSNLNVAYVNVDTLLNHYDLYNTLMINYYNKQNKYEKQLQSKLNSIQQQALTLQDNYKKGLITSLTYQQKMQKLQVEQQNVQQWYQQKSQELAQDQQIIMMRVTDSVMNTINRFNKDKKYHLILNKSALLYGDPGMDITDTLIEIMNAQVNPTEEK